MSTEYKDIPVVILAGGLGSRLGEYTEKTPKPLVSIGGHILIDLVISMWENCGFTGKFIIAGGYKVEKLVEHFVGSTRNNVEVVDTGYATQTGGRIKRLEKLLPENFMLSYGDGLTSAPLQDLITNNLMSNMLVVHPKTRFGEVVFDSDKVVTEFSEKPITEKWANAGMFGFSHKLFDYIVGDVDILELDIFPRLIKDRGLGVQMWGGWWRCVDTPKDVKELEQEITNDRL